MTAAAEEHTREFTHDPELAHRRILVALRGLSAPLCAIDLARRIALALRAPLHGLFVWPSRIAPSDVPRLLSVAPEALAGMVLEVEVGDSAERFARCTLDRPVAFMVLPAEQESGPCGLGPVAMRALRGSIAGVIVVRNGAPARALRRILIPLDGTPSTAAAIAPAGDLCRLTGSAMDIVFVGMPKPPADPEPGEMAPPQYVDQPQHEWLAFSREFTERFLGAIAHCPPGVPARFFLRAGDPADEILRASRELDADLVTLVWHGHCEGAHGQVFQRILRSADVPVLVLRR